MLTQNLNFDITKLKTPCYVVDESLLIKNLEILKSVRERAGCKILLAQKAFSMYSVYPLIAKYLDGTTASGLFEARLGKEEFLDKERCDSEFMSADNAGNLGNWDSMNNKSKLETHVYSPAYSAADFREIVKICDHIIFNNIGQFEKFCSIDSMYNANDILEFEKNRGRFIEFGIRINPEYSEVETPLYDPCGENSRLGCKLKTLPRVLPAGISGLHFHTMCEQGADVLERTVAAVENKFGHYLASLKWLNLGGGHHITKDGYDIDKLAAIITGLKNKYDIEIYLEPGEAVALNAGFLVTEVLDIIAGENNLDLAITDASAACHMPDVLEMPYRPNIVNSRELSAEAYNYRLGGATCLAGDIIGDYSFDNPLAVGDRLVFSDMAIYTMVKNNTFNGMNLPSILLAKSNGEIEVIRTFSYEDFKSRL